MTKQQDFSMWSVNFILFCLANFLYYGAFYLYIPVLPQYVEMLGGTPADIGLVGGAFGLSSFIIRPYLGKLANEWGRKRMMLLGAISFALLFLLFGRVTGVVPLVVLRLAHGVCLAMYLAASAAYIADYAPVDRRGEVLDLSDLQCGFYGCFSSSRHLDTSAYTKLYFFVQRDFCYGISMLFRVTAAQGNESCL